MVEFHAADVDSELSTALLVYDFELKASVELSGYAELFRIETWDYEPGNDQEWNIYVQDHDGNLVHTTTMLDVKAGNNTAPEPGFSLSS
jgi:hypothetical protein